MTALYQNNPDVVYRPEGLDGAILFDPNQARVRVINLTAAFVWERLDGVTPLEFIRDELCQTFESPPDPEAVLGELKGFVEVLLREGLAAVRP